ncbi:ribose transport system permease protein [Ochrobactrum daejeonense]|uniref:Ribose transport system permease protein n=1 Tax=Brucella daejeonensis TaxID=659015 RepID=A0A7W9AX21_9HYPH|nr:ABC transporter permease [Brucella daejeonensis]MBB5701992.1 ribose transport system permease protein [Brucella daejeonensis]
MTNIRSIISRYGMAVVLLFLLVFFSFATDAFLSQQNITNVLRQVAMLGIASVGMALVVLTGGIDLSVGSVIALVGVVVALAMTALGLNVYAACLLGIATGAFVGLINGLAVTAFAIPPLIATLAMLTAVRGVVYILSGGLPIFGFPPEFSVFGRGMVGFIPVSVLTMIAVLAIGWILLNRTRYGRYLYAIGGNQEAARLSGISVNFNLIITYVLAGIFSAIAGIIMLSRLNSAQPNVATGFEMDVITAVVLGGISISGGEGRFSGVIFGILIIGVLSNGMILLNVQDYWQLVIKGAVLMLAVGLDRYYARLSRQNAQKSQAALLNQPQVMAQAAK